MPRPPLLTLFVATLAACGPATPETPRFAAPSLPTTPPFAPPPLMLPPEAPPTGRLPTDERPTRYRVEMRVDPARPRFEGVVDIAVDLDRLRDVLWLHGRDLTVTRAWVEPQGFAAIPARWEPASKSGVAALRPAIPVGPGKVGVHVEYSAAFGGHEEGLYALEREGKRYAFTQFEATYARRAFPCFDEPAWKTPYEIVLHVPKGSVAVANTPEASRAEEMLPASAEPGSALVPHERIVFAPTEPLPTYLVALAVGPLDVVTAPPVPPNAVRARPLPLRGVATSGHGKELAHALAHTGEIVSALEAYFGIAYPYEKLDMLAVPDMSGAMENAGAITFAESLLLLDEKALGPELRYRFTSVAAHEISHQWFGDLVTMPWWDDIWLNEAFATWAETHITAAVAPELAAGVHALASVHEAMDADSRVAARKIRQEIEGDDDIENAFDSITYDKGGGVIRMFERWVGPDAFRKGIHAYLEGHSKGSGTSADLLSALSAAAGRDVAGPFRTFLDQPGLPFVEASVACDGQPRLLLRQSRFLPLGSSGDDKVTWQIPVCARYGIGDGGAPREACTLLTGREGALPLDACPTWVMPNADGAGYYRWSLAPDDAKKLAATGYGALGVLERLSFAESRRAAFVRGRLPAAEALAALAPFAGDPSAEVAGVPMELAGIVDDWLADGPLREAVRAWERDLYAPAYKALGWAPSHVKGGAAEAPERALLRKEVVTFLALTARDAEVRRAGAPLGRAYAEGRPDAVSLDLASVALAVAVQEGDLALFATLSGRLSTEQRPLGRKVLLFALGSATQPDLAARARELALDPRLRGAEPLTLLDAQLGQPETREAAWAWTRAHLDALLERLPESWRSALVWKSARFCDRPHAEELEPLFRARIEAIPGGPRELAAALEEMKLCVARRSAEEPSARAFFAKKKRR